MRKSIIFFFLFAIVFSLASMPVAAAEEGISAYAIARDFATAHPIRDAKSGKELAASVYLKNALSSMGYAVTTAEQTYYDVKENGGERNAEAVGYCNVIGTRDLGKKKTVVIGGYYGGFPAQDKLGSGEGGEIALGVGLLLSVADELKNASADYNVAIAFWGGAEFSDFRLESCGVPLDSIALYIGVDAVGAGAKDYLYCDDVPRSHERYIRSVISSVGANVSAAPAYKRPSLMTSEDGGYSFVHLGLLGVNSCFMDRNIPCAAFVGGDWEKDCGLYRYSDKPDISGTNLDSIDEIDSRNGGKEVTAARLDGASKAIAEAVSGSGLRGALEKAEGEVSAADLDSSFAYALIILIGGAGAIAFFLIFFLKQKKDRRDIVWRQASSPDPSRADPFAELKGEEKENNDEEDDVFRF